MTGKRSPSCSIAVNSDDERCTNSTPGSVLPTPGETSPNLAAATDGGKDQQCTHVIATRNSEEDKICTPEGSGRNCPATGVAERPEKLARMQTAETSARSLADRLRPQQPALQPRPFPFFPPLLPSLTSLVSLVCAHCPGSSLVTCTPNVYSILTPFLSFSPLTLTSQFSLFIGQIIIDFILRQAPARLSRFGWSIPSLYLPAPRTRAFSSFRIRQSPVRHSVATMSSSEDDTPLVKMNGRSSGKFRPALVSLDATSSSHAGHSQ